MVKTITLLFFMIIVAHLVQFQFSFHITSWRISGYIAAITYSTSP